MPWCGSPFSQLCPVSTAAKAIHRVEFRFCSEGQACVFTPVLISWTIIFAIRRTASDGIVRRTSPVSLSKIETSGRWAFSFFLKRMPLYHALRLLFTDSSAFSREDLGV